MKTIESKIAPNPKEAQIWVDLGTDPHGLVKKYWNGKKWVTKENNTSSKEDIENINKQLEEIKSSVEFLLTHHDEYILKMVKDLTNRVTELEQLLIA